MEESRIMEEVKELIPEVVTEVQIDETTDGHPLVKVAIIGLAALGGAAAGYLFKRHRDAKWTRDFDDGEDDYRPEAEELDDDSSEEKGKN